MKLLRIRDRGVSLLFVICTVIVASGCAPAQRDNSDTRYHGDLHRPPIHGLIKITCENWPDVDLKDASEGYTIHPGVKWPSYFYEQCIQPIWDANCLDACHTQGGNHIDGTANNLWLINGSSYRSLIWGYQRVVPYDDNNNAGKLLQRTTGVGPLVLPALALLAPYPPTTSTSLASRVLERSKRFVKSLADIFVICSRIKTGSQRGHKQLVLKCLGSSRSGHAFEWL